ncbi:hypothetical protein U9M48_036153 [Paspalum notatum var. saurae]|uniref:Uncharacterized protein n=1 Tax=Paspalum notatum var. saurae TaxID=547442 RepID=A0AAQ3UE04_PASNO
MASLSCSISLAPPSSCLPWCLKQQQQAPPPCLLSPMAFSLLPLATRRQQQQADAAVPAPPTSRLPASSLPSPWRSSSLLHPFYGSKQQLPSAPRSSSSNLTHCPAPAQAAARSPTTCSRNYPRG